MIKIFITSLLFFFPLIHLKSNQFERDYELIADSITNEVTKKLCKKYGLAPRGSGGSMMYDVKMMMIGLGAEGSYSIEEARILVIKCAQEYLERINSDAEIRPYLHNYPFTANNVMVTIYFYDPKTRTAPINSLCLSSVFKNEVEFCIKNKNDMQEVIHTESYEEAQRIVAQTKSPPI